MLNFLSRLNVVGRMRDAEAEAGCLAFRNMILNRTLEFGASEYEKAVSGLKDIAATAGAVNTPNGTTVKIGRIATETLNGLLTVQVEQAEQAVGA